MPFSAKNIINRPLYILGINCGHDASAALMKDNKIIAVVQEERKTREKHKNGFPSFAINEVLDIAGITGNDVDFIACAGNDRRLESIRELFWALSGRKFYSYAGIFKRFKTLVAEYTKNYWQFRENLKKYNLHRKKCFYFEHHLCHASSAYRNSGLTKTLVVTIDGVGDDVSASVNIGDSGAIKRIAQTSPENSLGFLYQAVTEALGFVPVEGEYKTMGLAAYGNQSKLYNYFDGIIKCRGLQFESKYLWESDLCFPAPTIKQHKIFQELLKSYRREDIAAACQAVTENIILKFVKNALAKTAMQDICAAGGVFLNVKANKLVRESLNLRNFYIHPDAGDSGLALGAAMELYFRITGNADFGEIEHVYYGREYSDSEIEKELKKYKVSFTFYEDIEKKSAELLSSGKVIGWFQGRMEMGPRALGNRSVLADPRNFKAKERINKYLKKRDWFVPFAPSLLDEDARIFIKDRHISNSAYFMIMAYDANEDKKTLIPAVVHIDNTLRPQIVKKENNSRYWRLISHFKQITGIGLLLNTSFNRHGLPIVESPCDAIEHLLDSNVDILVMGNYLVERI